MISKDLSLTFLLDGSMGENLSRAKKEIANLCKDVPRELCRKGYTLGTLRARIVVFRDYVSDESPMEISPWYDLTSSSAAFDDRLAAVAASGAKGKSKNGLEALYLATKEGLPSEDKMELLFLCSENDAMPLGSCKGFGSYPKDMGNYAALLARFKDNPQWRLVLIAKEPSRYKRLSEEVAGARFIPFDLEGSSADYPIAYSEMLNDLFEEAPSPEPLIAKPSHCEHGKGIDIVFLIDGSEGFADGIGLVKERIKDFAEDVRSAALDLGEGIRQMRFKTIVFRDYLRDESPMEVSEWFLSPEGDASFSEHLDRLSPKGEKGPKNGLEAIYLALCSDFANGWNDRQVIVLMTTSDALAMGEGASSPAYPKDMGNLIDLVTAWMNIAQNQPPKLGFHNKRLIMFAPEGSRYEELTSVLEGSMFRPISSLEDLQQLDFSDVVKVLFCSPGIK